MQNQSFFDHPSDQQPPQLPNPPHPHPSRHANRNLRENAEGPHSAGVYRNLIRQATRERLLEMDRTDPNMVGAKPLKIVSGDVARGTLVDGRGLREKGSRDAANFPQKSLPDGRVLRGKLRDATFPRGSLPDGRVLQERPRDTNFPQRSLPDGHVSRESRGKQPTPRTPKPTVVTRSERPAPEGCRDLVRKARCEGLRDEAARSDPDIARASPSPLETQSSDESQSALPAVSVLRKGRRMESVPGVPEPTVGERSGPCVARAAPLKPQFADNLQGSSPEVHVSREGRRKRPTPDIFKPLPELPPTQLSRLRDDIHLQVNDHYDRRHSLPSRELTKSPAPSISTLHLNDRVHPQWNGQQWQTEQPGSTLCIANPSIPSRPSTPQSQTEAPCRLSEPRPVSWHCKEWNKPYNRLSPVFDYRLQGVPDSLLGPGGDPAELAKGGDWKERMGMKAAKAAMKSLRKGSKRLGGSFRGGSASLAYRCGVMSQSPMRKP